MTQPYYHSCFVTRGRGVPLLVCFKKLEVPHPSWAGYYVCRGCGKLWKFFYSVDEFLTVWREEGETGVLDHDWWRFPQEEADALRDEARLVLIEMALAE